MTPAEIIARVRISDVAEALGVKLDRTRRRCICPWRKGANGWNVSLDDTKGTWWDHARSEGGGLVDFVARVRDCDRRAALDWLAGYAGVQLDRQSDADRRDWAKRMRAAEPEAKRFLTWKQETIAALRLQRNRLQTIYHNAVRFVLSHDADQCEAHSDFRYELALEIGFSYWPRVEALDAQIDALEAAPYSDLLKRFGLAS